MSSRRIKIQRAHRHEPATETTTTGRLAQIGLSRIDDSASSLSVKRFVSGSMTTTCRGRGPRSGVGGVEGPSSITGVGRLRGGRENLREGWLMRRIAGEGAGGDGRRRVALRSR